MRRAAPDITFVSSLNYLEPGAAQSRHLAYFRGLVEQGASVRVLLLSHESTAGLAELTDAAVDLRPLSRARRRKPRAIRAAELAGAVRRASRQIGESSADVVVLLDAHPAILLPLLRTTRRLALPTLHERTEHPEVVAPTGPYGSALLHTYYRYCLPQFAGIFAITQPLLMFLLAKTKPEANGVVVNMIVDTTRFPVARAGAERRSGEIVHAGSLVDRKDGVGTLVKALALVRCMPGTAEAYVSLYGPPAGAPEVEDLVSELGLPEGAVRLQGLVPSTEIPGHLANADALALARPDSMQARYGFPTKLGEYLASGTPTVCTSVGQIPRFLTDRKTAFLAPPGDIQAFAKALHAALTDPDRLAVAEAAKELADSAFSRQQAAHRIMELASMCWEG